MIFTAWSDGRFDLAGRQTHCALGRSGVIEATDKREGDGASPLGVWPIRRLLFRPDRGAAPVTALPTLAIAPDDGWCDAPEDPAYNQPVKRPYPASSEALWRDDGVYDLIAILAHNDDPPIPGLGSAIFLHLARDGYAPTEGCVALNRADLEDLLRLVQPGSAIAIRRT
ncbi:MAG: L,D-transpeptidase family protein [Caulobacteraceae bacterium]|nr:L,D-transpeptidase family protein [Caulobacteraceae bacterium]